MKRIGVQEFGGLKVGQVSACGEYTVYRIYGFYTHANPNPRRHIVLLRNLPRKGEIRDGVTLQYSLREAKRIMGL